MSDAPAVNGELLQKLYRSEYAKLIAVVCRRFSVRYYEIAEDIVGETFLRAAESWDTNGTPDNPAAWLYTVAANKTKDYLKRWRTFETKVKPAIAHDAGPEEEAVEFTDNAVADSRLAMIFAVCDPVNGIEAQIALALQILCGFSVEEIADAFLTNRETVKKRLLRARTNLRERNFTIEPLSPEELLARLPAVLRTLYLVFNEGYASQSGNTIIRRELCLEALSLTLVVIKHPATNVPATNALVALMCYQSSRLDARTDNAGDAILYEAQNRSRWDAALIDKGNYYLVEACTGNELSKYHLEAAIAYWHTTGDARKWEQILSLYNELVVIEYSPLAALNRAFAYAEVYGYEKGIAEAEKLALDDNRYYHALLGRLHASGSPQKAIDHYRRAIALTRSLSERRTLTKALERLSRDLVS